MKMNKNSIASIVAVVVVIGAFIIIAMGGNNKNDATNKMKMTKSDTSSSAAAPANAVEANTVSIDDYKFVAPAIKVKVGTTVTWTNMDSVKHNVVADKTSADAPNGPLLAKGETYSFTFKKAGTYSYHCDPHPYMKATVTATE